MFSTLPSWLIGSGGLALSSSVALAPIAPAVLVMVLVALAAICVVFAGLAAPAPRAHPASPATPGSRGRARAHGATMTPPSDRLLGYREFLAARDGVPDPLRRTLSRREEFFDRLARDPVRSKLSIDRERYLRNLDRQRPEPGLDARMLWLLASAKVNRAERFGVGFGELYGKVRLDDDDPIRVHLPLQEIYHTRILADAVAIFGLPVHPRPPELFTRNLIRLIVSLPERWGLPVTGFAEMAGCVAFRALRERGLELFADEPAVAERIRLLYDEILADEVSHVGYIAAQLGPGGRWVMRLLYRRLARQMLSQMPEMVALFGRDELKRRFTAEFELDKLAAEFPGRAYATALAV